MRVALTFDAEHPSRPCSGDSLDSILDALEAADARATFFVQGRWAQSNPDDAVRLAEAHLVGNHSHHHAPMSSLTAEGFREDVREAEEAITAITGRSPLPWFRCPFGAGMDDSEVLRRLAELGYRHVGWDVDPRDWDEANDARDLEITVLESLLEREDSIVLLHSWPDATAEALPRIIDGMAHAGAELVDVEMLGR
jgi:peptidoglycan-N-acetylglucosamine deacetylase